MSIATQGFGGHGLVTAGYGVTPVLIEEVVETEGGGSGKEREEERARQRAWNEAERRRRRLLEEYKPEEIEPAAIEQVVIRALKLPESTKEAVPFIEEYAAPVIPETPREFEREIEEGAYQVRLDMERIRASQEAILRFLELKALVEEEEFLIILLSLS